MTYKTWLLAIICVCAAQVSVAAEIAISCGAVGLERQLCEQATSAWAEQSGHSVSVTSPPHATTERYFKYLIELGDGNDSIDVYQIDVIWPGLLAKFFLDLKEYIAAEDITLHYPQIIANNTVDGRLVGMPWFTDVGVLYYRRDLLEKYDAPVPKTWSQLADVALHVQSEERTEGNPEFWGFVFQGDAYEGLSCNALEWINSYGGGTLVEADGTITVNNTEAAAAIARAASWVGISSPERVVSFQEEDARIFFEQGNAAFMRNWPYAWALLNASGSPVAGKLDVAPLPTGGLRGKSSATLGGWQLAVSKFSKNPAIAADLVRYLTSETVQKQRAVAGSYAPTIARLYDDPDVLAANPFFSKLRPILKNAVARPSAPTGEKYMAVSTRFWEAVHDVLQGKTSAANSLSALESQLKLIQARGGW